MTRRVIPYSLAVGYSMSAWMPKNAPILRVGKLPFCPAGQLTLWLACEVDTSGMPAVDSLGNRQFTVIGDHVNVPIGHEYVGSAEEGGHVWHVFEARP